jgi:hypothetical protein
VVGVAGYTGYFTSRIERHINGDIHGWDYMHGMRRASGCLVVVSMTGYAYLIGSVGEGDMVSVERQPRMAVITKDLSALIVDGI